MNFVFSRRFFHKVKRDYNSDFFQSARTDQNSSTKFYKTIRCQIGPFGTRNWNLKKWFLFSALDTIPGETKGPLFSFFSALWEVFSNLFSPKGPPSIFWMFCDKMDVENLLCLSARSVVWVFQKCFESFLWVWNFEFFDTLMSFCCYWALVMPFPACSSFKMVVYFQATDLFWLW